MFKFNSRVIVSRSHFFHRSPKLITRSIGFTPKAENDLIHRLISILQSCNDPCLLPQGRQVHAQITLGGYGIDGPIGSKILGMYIFCGSILDAKNIFFRLDLGRCMVWNWMIRGFTLMGWFDFALLFYFKMLSVGTYPDKYTFPYVFKACNSLNAVSLGRWIHNMVSQMGLEMDMYVGSSLVKFYADNDHISDARHVFDKMSEKDVVLWNAMLHGYAKSGDIDIAFELLKEMRFTDIQLNSVAFVSILSLCASEGMLKYGSVIHGLVMKYGLELDPPVANTLLAMYAKCQCLSDTRKLFDMMPQTDLVAWNGMMAGYVQNGLMSEALNLFSEMISSGVKPDSFTFASLLPSVSEAASLKQGKEIHCYIIRSAIHVDVFLNSALIDLYFKCRKVDMASRIFKQSTYIDVVICTAMISGYVLHEMSSDALGIFRLLVHQRMRPTSVTLASVLPACAGLVALKLGKELHGNILKSGHEGSCFVSGALMDMYSKCGRLDLAHQVFRRTSRRDAILWNTMITNCAQNGTPENAIDLFRQMAMVGTNCDCVSISAALSACSNLPAAHYGKEIHGFMVRHAFNSDVFACSALVDFYAKCGSLDFAQRVFNMMPVKNEIRSLMKERGVQKTPGYSWIEINNATHMFVAADKNHTESAQIYHVLKILTFECEEKTMVPSFTIQCTNDL
ncbi:Pentatricopeptide repeat [Dillenia turbinata]|uniref:Pentatricopeptide repeat n=1 Tax=Dillenia turbinata TaxID=194707 RepID=A0AAN8Z195_9MAGN